MSGFKVNFSVNNQLSTPSIHAAPFAQRPAAGQPGRVFIDSDNPSTGIYRDTGTTWVAIGNPSSPDVDTLQIVTDRGNTTTNSITVGAATSPVGTIDVRRTTPSLNGANDWAIVAVNNPTIPNGASFGVNGVSSVNGSQSLIFQGSATINNTGLNSAGEFINSLGSTGAGTVTVGQSTTIRTISGIHTGIYYNTAAASTFTHVAAIKTIPPINSGAAAAAVTNYYGVLVANSTPSSGTVNYTNRFGIYQEGASDVNFFAGNLGVNISNPASRLEINGTSRFYNTLSIQSGNVVPDVLSFHDGNVKLERPNGSTNFNIYNNFGGQFNFINGASTLVQLRGNGNLLVGTVIDSGYKLDIANGALRVLDGGTDAIRLQQSTTANQGITFRLGNTEYGRIFVNTGNGTAGFLSSYNLQIAKGGQPGIVVGTNAVGINYPASGGVGVYTLDVFGSIGNSWAGTGAYLIGNSGSPQYSFVSDADNGWGRPSADNQSWTTNNVERMRLDASGNFGINTTSPAARLHVNGTLRIDGQSSGTAGGSSGQHLIINLDGTTYKIALLNP